MWLPWLPSLPESPSWGAVVTLLLICLPCCSVNASRWPGPYLCPQGSGPCPACIWGLGALGTGMESGVCEHVGGSLSKGWGWLHACSPSLLESQARRSPPKGVSGVKCW